jgi:hypothetical protein
MVRVRGVGSAASGGPAVSGRYQRRKKPRKAPIVSERPIKTTSCYDARVLTGDSYNESHNQGNNTGGPAQSAGLCDVGRDVCYRGRSRRGGRCDGDNLRGRVSLTRTTRRPSSGDRRRSPLKADHPDARHPLVAPLNPSPPACAARDTRSAGHAPPYRAPVSRARSCRSRPSASVHRSRPRYPRR